jgi:LacI family transcriptional regulator
MRRRTNQDRPSREVALALNLHNAYDRKIVAGIARFLRENRTWHLFFETELESLLPDPRRWSGDGVIADLDDSALARRLPRLKIPVVGIGGAVVGSGKDRPPYVGTDNTAIGLIAAEHLIECGFRNFAYCGVRRTPTNPWSALRQEAFQARLHQEGFESSVHVGRTHRVTSWKTIQSDLSKWLDSLEKPVAIMACNDARARHVLEAARRQGYKVPDDVAVLGVDDDELVCELGTPSLSSVVQGTDLIGYTAAEMLEQLMAGKHLTDPFRTIPPVGVATRGSTDVLATDVPEVATAVAIIRNEIHDIDGQRVSAAVKLSRPRLDRLFTDVLGHSLHAQIARERLRSARRLISRTDLPLKEIASRAGYRTPQYMCAVFQRETGESPAQFRSRAGATSSPHAEHDWRSQ